MYPKDALRDVSPPETPITAGFGKIYFRRLQPMANENVVVKTPIVQVQVQEGHEEIPADRMRNAEQSAQERAIRELRYFSLLTPFPYIVDFYGFILDNADVRIRDLASGASYKYNSAPRTMKLPCIVLKRCEKVLFHVIRENRSMSLKHALADVLLPAAECLVHFKNYGVVHCDFLAKNMLVVTTDPAALRTTRHNFKVCDFGSMTNEGRAIRSSKRFNYPPDDVATNKTDVFSWGVLAFELMMRRNCDCDNPRDAEYSQRLLCDAVFSVGKSSRVPGRNPFTISREDLTERGGCDNKRELTIVDTLAMVRDEINSVRGLSLKGMVFDACAQLASLAVQCMNVVPEMRPTPHALCGMVKDIAEELDRIAAFERA